MEVGTTPQRHREKPLCRKANEQCVAAAPASSVSFFFTCVHLRNLRTIFHTLPLLYHVGINSALSTCAGEGRAPTKRTMRPVTAQRRNPQRCPCQHHTCKCTKFSNGGEILCSCSRGMYLLLGGAPFTCLLQRELLHNGGKSSRLIYQ